jgi:hypothetical protein
VLYLQKDEMMDERQAIEIKTLAARGIIADAVSRLSMLLVSRRTPGAEEMRLQDLFLHHTREYVQATHGGPGALAFMVSEALPVEDAPSRTLDPSSATGSKFADDQAVDLDAERMRATETDLMVGLSEIANTLPVGRPRVPVAAE